MFTTGAFALTTLLAWFAYRKNEQERSTYYQAGDQAPWEQIDAKPRLWHHGQVLDRVARCGPQYAARYMRSRSFWMLREKRPSISRCRATHYSAFQPRLDQSDASAGDSGGNFWQRSRRCHQPSRLISSVAKPLRGKVAQGFSSTSSLTRRTKWRRTSNSG
jgi:hypothetical protein